MSGFAIEFGRKYKACSAKAAFVERLILRFLGLRSRAAALCYGARCSLGPSAASCLGLALCATHSAALGLRRLRRLSAAKWPSLPQGIP